MRFAVLLLVALTSIARADKIAVVDSDRLYEKGGITRWLAAKAKLDEERKKFKVVESTSGKRPPTPMDCNSSNQQIRDACQNLNKMQKEQYESGVWGEHEKTVLDPIESEIGDALQAFSKARGITILFEKEETMLYVAPSADITDAFIKDFNARPAPKPKK